MLRLSHKRKKIIICIFPVILLFMITGICFLDFGEKQIQNAIKNKICNNVIKYEDELQEVVKKCPLEEALYYYKKDADDDYDNYKTIYYMDLEDENVNKIFKTFRLISVDKNEDNSVEFTVNPPITTVLWDNYRYGFYYTVNDKPIDVVHGSEVKETEFEITIVGLYTYWYRTEKIIDNFWYYETKEEWDYVKKR